MNGKVGSKSNWRDRLEVGQAGPEGYVKDSEFWSKFHSKLLMNFKQGVWLSASTLKGTLATVQAAWREKLQKQEASGKPPAVARGAALRLSFGTEGKG